MGEIGHRGLLLLAFMLPFDMERQPLLWTSYVSITNLTVLFFAMAGLATVSVAGVTVDALRGSAEAADYFRRRGVALVLLLAYLISALVSTLLARMSTQQMTWFLGIAAGALLWLALPLWLADDTKVKVNRLGMALVAGAAIASCVGLVEIMVGSAFDQHLTLFKFGPSTTGPFLRLSTTFSSANVAAVYMELALPFAVAGLIAAGCMGRRRWMGFVVWLAVLDLLFIALLLTYSRGAFLGLLAAVSAMALAGRGAWTARGAGSWQAWTVVAASLALVAGFFASTSSAAEILRFSAQTDSAWYQAAYVSAVPRTMAAGRTRIIPVIVSNRGPLTWNASQPRTYGLSYHWLLPSRKLERFANTITWLSSDLSPGGRRTIHAGVTTPNAPGEYLLVWDMVWKGTTWFGPRTGTYPSSPVRVTNNPYLTITHNPPPDIPYLPTATALTRGQIWAVAEKMIEQRPFFGVGPQGVRMNYGAFAPPGELAQAGKPPPHAHNLLLEMFADWGALGGGLFFALLAVIWWPLMKRVWRGRVNSAWQLAVIGSAAALLGHQAVDYFLTKQSIFIMLWILCGLAASTAPDARDLRVT